MHVHAKTETCKRWIDVLFLTFLAVFLCLFLQKPFDSLASRLGDILALRQAWFRYLLIAVLAGSVCLLLNHWRALGLSSRWYFYPPTWFASVAGSILYYLIDRLSAISAPRIQALDILTVLAGGTAALFVAKLRKHICLARRGVRRPGSETSRGDDTYSPLLDINTPEALFAWLDEEKPVESPNQDRFGAAQPARRICRHLLDTPLKTIGILGEFGSGKSTVLKLVEYYLAYPEDAYEALSVHGKYFFDPRNIVICRVGAWGFRGGSAARQILESMLDELSEHMDVLPFVGIPGHYQTALAESDMPWAKAFSQLVSRREDPLNLLTRIDTALECQGIRLVVFVEDVDRNGDDALFYREVGALLDHLKNLRNVSFVLACGYEQQAAAMLARICEHTEMLLPVSEYVFSVIFTEFRDSLLSRYPDDIETVSQGSRDQRFGFTLDPTMMVLFGSHQRGLASDIAELLSTPRSLKHLLRRTRQAYDSLHGEIDFDDLFVTTLLRIVMPDAFAFLALNIQRLRKGALADTDATGIPVVDRQITAELKESFEKSLQNDPERTTLVKNLILFLTPKHNRIAQGVGDSTFTDYWARLNAEEIPTEELRDQIVLREILRWQNDHNIVTHMDVGLAELLLTRTDWADKVEQFGDRLSPQEVRALAQQLFALIREGKGERVKRRSLGDEPFSGFVELWRLALKHREPDHEKWIQMEIEKALAVDLRFANDLFCYWCSAEQGLVDAAGQTRLRNAMIAKARELFENNPELLVSVLDSRHIYTLSYLMVGLSKPEFGGKGFRSDEWVWLSDSLISAAQKIPDVAMPQLVPLLSDPPIEAHSVIFNNERLEGLFKGREMDVMRLLTSGVNVAGYNSREQKWILILQDYARNWLAQRSAE